MNVRKLNGFINCSDSIITNKKTFWFYKLILWIILTSSLHLCFLVNIHVWSTITQWWNINSYNTLKLEVIHAGSCLTIFHPEILDTQNKLNHWMTEKRAYILSKRWWKSRWAKNGQECDRSLIRPRNRKIPGMI